MTTPLQRHYEFEEAVYAAFPRHPIPNLDDWAPQTWFERDAKPLFADKTWPEIIGLRMRRNELDASLVTWTGFIPSKILAYYLPAHLMFGSILLRYGCAENYVGELVEGFMLPPPGLDADPGAGEEIDDEFGLGAGVIALQRTRPATPGREPRLLAQPGVTAPTKEEKRMSNRLAAVLNGLLVLAMFVIGFLAIYKLPPGGQVAIHWGSDNRPDAWVGGSAIQLINPIVALVIWFVSQAKPVSTPQRRLSNIFLIQLVVQLLMALYLR